MQENLPIDFRALVYRGVESDELDYKSPLNWNNMPRTARAKIVRHLMALANTKGGYIVIGVGEDASGHPSVYSGMTPEQLHSFDPSVVGPFVNRHVEPPIDFTIERPEVDGKRYVVIVVRPFSSLPHVCAYGVDGELQQGVFYIRTTDASSRAAVRALEMHGLVQRALRNQREILGRMLRGILYDARSEKDTTLEHFWDEAFTTRNYFLHRKKDFPPTQVRLELLIFPPEYDANRFTFSDLRHAVIAAGALLPEQHFLQEEDMPDGYCTNTAFRIFPKEHDRIFQISKSGGSYFTLLLPASGRQISFLSLLKMLSQAISFAGKAYAELGFLEQELSINITLDNADHLQLEDDLPGRKSRGNEKAPSRSFISEIAVHIKRSAADLSSAVEIHSAKLLREIGERFNMPEECYRKLPEIIKSFLENRS